MRTAKIAAIGPWLLAACSAADPQPIRPAPSGSAVIALAGDAMLGRAFNRILEVDPDFRVFRGLEPHLVGVEVLAFNLETTITSSDDLWEGKNFNFRLDPTLASRAFATLPSPTDVPLFASFANNHALDFGPAGLTETLASLDALDVTHAGAGLDEPSTRQLRVIETAGGVRVGFMAASTHCSCGDPLQWAPHQGNPGMWVVRERSASDLSETLAAVRAARAEVDWLVFSIHWGRNWVPRWPVDWMDEFAAELVAAGVDIVHGHSAHHVLPVQTLETGVVLFGSGDFVDDYGPVEGYRPELSYLARVELVPGAAPALELVPLRISHERGHHVAPLQPGDADHDFVLEQARWP